MRRNGLLSSVVLAACLTPSSLYAQQQTQQPQPPRPGVVVVSYNKCRLDAVARLDSAGLRAFYPVLDEVVREGRLLGWGVLTHNWGDEWNFVIYYTATNAAAFHSAFAEAVRRINQRAPTFFSDVSSLCTEHKDNIYAVVRLGSASPPATVPPPR
jgi:hypothetical protein